MSSKDDRKDNMDKERKVRRKLKREGDVSAAVSTVDKKSKVTLKVEPKPKTDPRVKNANARAIFNHEEEEAARRDPDKDLEIQAQTCNEIRDVMEEIKKLKKEGKTEEAEDSRVHGLLQFIVLKKMNRLGHMRCKLVREETSKAKQEIDKHHLKLQNLLYEVMHLQKEINKCLQFKSKDEDINLVSVEEFYEEAPPEISKPEATKKDLHQQTLARLDWELEQRTKLADKLKDTQGTRENIDDEIKKKTEYLESLQPKLNTILQATKPVQEYLKMPFDETREQHRAAAYLPRPLYVLYMQGTAYKDACDKKIEVTIHGDADVAKAMEVSSADVDDDSDSDQEEQEKKRKRRRRSSDRQTVLREKWLKKHPLSIQFNVNCTDGSTLQLTFYYLMALHIVTVNVRVKTQSNAPSISGGDLLNPDSLLGNLYAQDKGEDSPNSAIGYMLSKAGLKSFPHYIKEVGRPYQWAQHLAGLQFLKDSTDPPRAETSLSAIHMEETIKQMRARVDARLALQRQLAALERSSVVVNKEYQTLFPAKVVSRLSRWSKTTFDDFKTCRYTSGIVDADLASETDMFYSGAIERGSAKMYFQVAIQPDYPSSVPVFALYIMWNNERTGQTDESIRDMEAEVNVHYEDLIGKDSRDQLLTNQVQRLLMCFDVYLETESDNLSQDGPVEFGKEKVYPRVTRGPQRGKPYKYNSQLGFFTQR